MIYMFTSLCRINAMNMSNHRRFISLATTVFCRISKPLTLKVLQHDDGTNTGAEERRVVNNASFVFLPILKSEHIHMKDETAVLRKIKKIIDDGVKTLQIITDFDSTLTKQHDNGTRMPDSVAMFIKSKQLPESCRKKDNEISKKYKIHPNSPIEEKIDASKNWYAETHENLQGHNFDPQEIVEMANEYRHSLRDGTDELFAKLKKLDVPIVIFSAGLGDMVEAILRCCGISVENIKIISNYLKFDDNTLDGFRNSDRIIHPFNKNIHAVEDEYLKTLQDRKNVILMGDTLGDASMAHEANGTENILRIGFLYNEETRLPSYKDAFDIVLVYDQTMNVVLRILSLIV